MLLAFVTLVLRPGAALAGVIAAALLVARAAGAIPARVRRGGGGRTSRGARDRGRTGPVKRGAAVVTITSAALVVIAAYSYVGAITERSNSSFGIRSVEWLRGNGAAGLVSDVEHFYYSANAPARGGRTLVRLPSVGFGGGSRTPRARLHNGRVKPIGSVIRPSLPGEGVWRATQGRYANKADSPVLLTTYRPDPAYPRVLAGVALINPRAARIGLYPGIQEPPGGSSSGLPSEVPRADRQNLVATFNSGFKFSDASGGFFAGGRLLAPLRPGLATFVGTRSGKLDITSWSGPAHPGSDVAFARQNLPLIVDGGRPSPALSDGPEWGTTVGNSVMVWRSGIGVDAQGRLIYAAANYRTVRGLADILVHAGAVRAMELDINSYWVTFNTYGGPDGAGARKLLDGMDRPAERYLTPDDRDFFAVYTR